MSSVILADGRDNVSIGRSAAGANQSGNSARQCGTNVFADVVSALRQCLPTGVGSARDTAFSAVTAAAFN